jgi:RHS repeat-associated protein
MPGSVTNNKPNGGGSETQVTWYIYGSELDGSDSNVFSNDLLRAVIYAGSDDTFIVASKTFSNGSDGYDRVEYNYNRQGEVDQLKDQNGTVHDYLFDRLGRQISDEATTLGAGVNGTIRRIDTSYEIRGMLDKVTSYDETDDVVNEVALKYNAFGQLLSDSQEHNEAVDADTLKVSYGYAGVISGLRLETVSYPKKGSDPSRTIRYDYDDLHDPDITADGLLNRLYQIKDSNHDVLAQYSYLGLGSIVAEDYVKAGVRLDYRGTTAGTYSGLDRFGRVIDQVWKKDSDNSVVERYGYDYDKAGNTLWKENLTPNVPLNLDETYLYDEVYRLIGTERGNLNAQKAIESKNFAQSWDLDSLGNSAGFKEDQGGNGWELNQTRETAANQISNIGEGGGECEWATPLYDKVGNMTRMPSAVDPTIELTCTYDAWNRLVSVSNGATTVTYAYDGLGRKIERESGGTVEHYFYSGAQVVETRTGTSVSQEPENLQPHYQYVYSARYVDAPILRDENTDSDGQCDDGRIYYLTDRNNNVTAVLDSTGAVSEHYVYDAYGKATIYDDAWTEQTDSAFANTILYGGRELDPTSGLYDFRARWYHPLLSQFVSQDPAGYAAGSMNLYQYVFSNPTRYNDPSGMQVTDGAVYCAEGVPGAVPPYGEDSRYNPPNRHRHYPDGNYRWDNERPKPKQGFHRDSRGDLQRDMDNPPPGWVLDPSRTKWIPDRSLIPKHRTEGPNGTLIPNPGSAVPSTPMPNHIIPPVIDPLAPDPTPHPIPDNIPIPDERLPPSGFNRTVFFV